MPWYVQLLFWLIDALFWVLRLGLAFTVVTIGVAAFFIVLYPLQRLTFGTRPPIAWFWKGVYMTPAIAILWLGIEESRPLLTPQFGPISWIITEIYATYLCLRWGFSMDKRSAKFFATIQEWFAMSSERKDTTDETDAVWQWIASWPGWGLNATEPTGSRSTLSANSLLALPIFTAGVSLLDSSQKLVSVPILGSSLMAVMNLLSLFWIVVSAAFTIYVFNATKRSVHAFGHDVQELVYPKHIRYGSLVSLVLVVSMWGLAAGYEPGSDLEIVAETLPDPQERLVELTLMNKGQSTRVLTQLVVEARMHVFIATWSASFDVPVVAEYDAPFHVAARHTAIPLRSFEQRQFQPGKPGIIKIGLRPDGSGLLRWSTYVRISVVSDDGKKSNSGWFRLDKQQLTADQIEQVMRDRDPTLISYAVADEMIAVRINDALRNAGVATMLYADDFPPLHPPAGSLAGNHHGRVIVLCSRPLLERPGVASKIEDALRREAREGGATMIVLVALDDYVFSAPAAKNENMTQAGRDRIPVDFRNTDGDRIAFDAAIDHLLSTLRESTFSDRPPTNRPSSRLPAGDNLRRP